MNASPAAAAASPEDDPGAAALAHTWADAAWAAALLAIDPPGLGGVVLRAGAGPVRDRWQADLRALLPATAPLRRMPGHIADDRLLGGLDLTATLRSGRPVAQRGLLAESDGGVVMVPMAERLPAATAARLAHVLDSGAVGFERDGLSTRWPARIAVIACDEGADDDGPLPAALLDRLAFQIDLRSLPWGACGEIAADAADIAAARALWPQVQADERVVQALGATAWQLGVDSLRIGVLALRAARAAAALGGRAQVSDEDALLAARLVLAPRATRLPPGPAEDTPAEDKPEEHAPADEASPPSPPAEPQPPADATPNNDKPPANDRDESTLADRLLEATAAALPAGLLAALRAGHGNPKAGAAGRAGAVTISPRFGRPVGTRRGAPGAGARLNLVETLRAAAPWQRLRRAAAPARQSPVHVQADDLRVSRLQQRAATATLFVIDASGSSALNRLAEAKGAVNLLLADCYVRRDQVAVIAFRGQGAEVLLPPTRSLVRAKRALAALPGGGGTPLAAGLAAALQMALQVRRAGTTPLLVLLTDGRANLSRAGEPGRARAEQDALAMASQCRAAGLAALLVDTSPQPAATAQRLAQAMAAHYQALPYADAKTLQAAVQGLQRR